MTTDDMDETARLLLMENPRMSLATFMVGMKDAHGTEASLVTVGELWRRYRGFDGRTSPTHDVDTGKRITTGGLR